MGNKRRWKNNGGAGKPNEFVFIANPRVTLKGAGRGRFEIQVDGVAVTDRYGIKLTYGDTTAKKYGEEIAKNLDTNGAPPEQ